MLALAIPVDCVCCGAEDSALCGACARKLRLLTLRPFRAEAQAPALMDMDGSVLLPVVAAGAYRAELAQCLLSFKRHGQAQLAANWPGDWRAPSPPPARPGGGNLSLVPVPTSGTALPEAGLRPGPFLLALVAANRAGRGAPRKSAHARREPVLRAFRGRPGGRLSGGQKGLARGARPGACADPCGPGPVRGLRESKDVSASLSMTC